MIRFLNASSVAGYAHIYTKKLIQTIRPTVITNEPSFFSHSKHDVVLYPHTGMAILQLKQTNGKIYSYYLDKAVNICPGTDFRILPLDSPCAVCILTDGYMETTDATTSNITEEPPSQYIQRIYTFFDQKHEAGFLFPGERHQPYELVCVLEGCLHNIVGGREYILTNRQAIILPPNTWHTQYGGSENVHFITVAFSTYHPLPTYSVLKKMVLDTTAISLLREMANDITDDRVQAKRLLCGIQFLLTPWLVCHDHSLPENKTSDAIHHENQILDTSLEFIATHIHEKLTITTVAKNGNVSVAYLSLLFQRYLHISPGAYIQQVRLEQAAHMLRRGSGTVRQIADELHFSSPQHFSTAFKKQYGITPCMYAKGKR